MYPFNTSEKQSLYNKLMEYLAQNPQDSPYFLEAIKKGLDAYANAVKGARDQQAYNAIDSLFMLYKHSKCIKKNKRLPFLLDSIMHNFPNGKKSIASELHKEIWEEFIELCKELKKDDESWLSMRNALNYYNEFIKGEIK